MESRAEDLRKHAAALRSLTEFSLADEVSPMCEQAAAVMDQRAEAWERKASEVEDDDSGEPEHKPQPIPDFDIAALFEDL